MFDLRFYCELINGEYELEVRFDYEPACRGGIDEPPHDEVFHLNELLIVTMDENNHELYNDVSYLLADNADFIIDIIKGEW